MHIACHSAAERERERGERDYNGGSIVSIPTDLRYWDWRGTGEEQFDAPLLTLILGEEQVDAP